MKRIIFAVTLFITASVSYSQLTVTTGLSAQQLANILAGYNIQVTNASVSGNFLQKGAFQYTGNNLGVNSGVILSSGNVMQAIGPNNSSGGASTGFNGAGNPLLTTLAGYQTFDAVVFQFDFQVQSDQIEFKYLFLSEEYNEYVGMGYNDVFAFFISGPGITGEENLAVVPGTTSPVSINSINTTNYWQFYHNNEPPNTNIQYDGFTTLMTAKKTGLIPCQTYRLKLMIADGSDEILDSGVLLQENSLVQANVSATANTFSDNNTALEGCVQANFTFQLDSAMTQNTSIPIGIGGTALNGVDYSHVDTLIIIPAGQTSATIIIDAIADGIPEGNETIEIYYSTGPCMDKDTVTLFINDYNLIEFTTSSVNSLCNGSSNGSVDINVTGGIPPYYVTLTDSSTGISSQFTTVPITGLNAATYYVNVMDGYGCVAEDIVNGAMFEGGAVFLPDGNGFSYSTTLNLSGFAPGQTLTDINQLQSICMNMEHSFMGDLQIVLQAPNGTQIELKHQPGGSKTNLGEPVATGSNDTHSWDTTPGVGYDYCFTQNPTYGTMVAEANNYQYTYITTQGVSQNDSYLPAGSYQSQQPLSNLIGVPLNGAWTLIVTDEIPNNNGYVFNWSISLTAEPPDSVVTVSQPFQPTVTNTNILPGCGMSNGAINITVTGSSSPYTYQWSNGPTTQDISGVSSGTYIVTITGADNCSYLRTYNLSNNGTLALNGTTLPSTCTGSNNGSVNLTVSGGTLPFNYIWNNSATTEDITGLTPANYTVTVTDYTGCNGIKEFTVSQLSPIDILTNITNENCGDHEGIINLSITGGSGAYTYHWSNNATTEDITDLVQGNYSVTVTDSNNCTSTGNWTVTNYVGNCIPNCDINITNAIVNNETCGNSAGSINLTVFTSFSPYSVQWSNSSTNEDIYMLHGGNYTVTITDAESCQIINTFNILNQTGTLSVTGVSVINESCGNNNGAINITVTGGALPNTYLWSNGNTSQNLVGVHAGHYYVTVTDANGCAVFADAIINNTTGTLVQTFGNVVNEVCGNHHGSIDIQISGGSGSHTYLWSNGVTSQDLINIGAGTYSCTITDANTCKLFTPVYTVLNESGTMALGYTDIDDEICNNNSGFVNITITGGSAPYTYHWSNNATTQDLTNIDAGSYSCTITDNLGCALHTPVYTVINSPGTLQLSDVSTIDELCNNNGGSINITVTGGTSPLTYLWNNSVASEDILNISAGNYSCTISDANNCQITVNSTINNLNGTLNISNIIVTNESCGNTNGNINIITGGGTTPYSYLWSSGQTTEDLTNISGGNYTVTIHDAQGCSITNDVTVNNIAGTLALGNTVITNEICSGSNGSVNISVTGTQTPFSYLWSNSATTQDISGIIAGTYTCTITDNSGCKIIAGSYIVNNTAPGMIVTTNSIIHENCGNGTGAIDISVSGGVPPYTYAWSNSASTQDVSGIHSGIYTVTITDINNCKTIKTYTINNNSGTLNISGATINNETCSNSIGAINITVSGGGSPYTYLWSNGATTEDLSGLHDGIYKVTITDALTCTIVSTNYTVSNSPGTFVVSNTVITNEICNNNNGSINISITGATMPVSYNWSNSAITQDISGLTSGNYSCTATDNNGCEIVIHETVGNDAGTLTLNNSIVSYASCNTGNGFIDITIAGGTLPYTFLWSNNEITEDISNLNSGTYTCLITDAAGCTISHTETLNTIGNTLLITNPVIAHEQCSHNNGSINISVSGGLAPYTYIWSSGQATQDIYNLSSATYSVTVTDINNCTASGIYNILNSNSLSFSNIYVNNDICGNNQGYIEISLNGGTFPYTYLWSNNATVEDLYYLTAGSFTITVTDAIGCTITNTSTVNNITNGLAITNAVVSNDSCGQNNGTVNLTISGGTAPYTYIWNNNEISEDISGLSGGNYYCTIMDNNGCKVFYSANILNVTNGLLIQNATVTNDTCNSYLGSVSITITGGNMPYQYIWNNGSINEDLNNVTSGNYNITITDNSGCAVGASYVVNNISNSTLGFQTISTSDDYCGNGQGSIAFIPSGTGLYTFELNGHQGGQPIHEFNNLTAGNYILAIWEGSCYYDTSVTVGNSGNFSSSIGFYGSEYCGNSGGFIDINVYPPDNYLFDWSNNVYTEDNFNLSAGTYYCTITDQTGCHNYLSATIDNNATFNVTTNVTNEVCGNSNGSINLTLTGNYLGSAFIWSNGSITQNISGISSGTYSCTITNLNNCIVITNATVNNITGSFGVNSQINDDFCSEGQGMIALNIIGDPGPYSYIWNTSETNDTLYNIHSGTYLVTVTNIPTGCSYYNSFNVGNSALFSVSEVINPSNCFTCNTGFIDITTIGSSPSYTYLWGNGETSEDLNNLLPGTYYLTVTDNWGCIVTDSFIVGFYNIISEEINEDFFNVYPNPSIGVFYIDYDFNNMSGNSVEIYELTGKLVLSQKLAESKGHIKIDLQQYPKGLYLIRKINGNKVFLYKVSVN